MIVYGHNSFKLDECKPSQLGMSPDLDQVYSIERRQRYAHLFWIPVFGIGKIWALRKRGDDKLYVPPSDLTKALDALPLAHKTPWYTYSFFILALAVGAIYWVVDTVGHYQRERAYEKQRIEKNQQRTADINSPKAHQYFDFSRGGSDHAYLKVLSSDAETIKCLYSERNSRKYGTSILDAFVTDAEYPAYDTVLVSKSRLLKTINTNDDYSFKGIEVLHGKGNFVLNDIATYSKPIFKSVKAAFEEGKFVAVVQNIGAQGVFESMHVDQSNLTLQEPLFADALTGGDYIYIRGTYADAEPQHRSRAYFKTSEQDSVAYNFSINGSYVSLEPANQ